MVFEQSFMWGRAYRNGRVVAARVLVTVVRDGEAWNLAFVRFCEGVIPAFRTDLERLARARGVYNRARIAERLAPVKLVTHDRRRGACQYAGRLEPPRAAPRDGPVEEIEYRLRPDGGGALARR